MLHQAHESILRKTSHAQITPSRDRDVAILYDEVYYTLLEKVQVVLAEDFLIASG
jgi:hypothetical protein